MDFLTIIGIAAIFQSLILLLIVLKRRFFKDASTPYLIALIVINVGMMCRDLLQYTGDLRDPFLLLVTEYQWSFLIGPSLYFYFISYVEKRRIASKEIFLHLIPYFIVSMFWAIQISSNLSNLTQLYFDRFNTIWSGTIIIAYWHLMPLIYLVMIILKIRRLDNQLTSERAMFFVPMSLIFIVVNLVSITIVLYSYVDTSFGRYVLPSSLAILCSMAIVVTYLAMNRGMNELNKLSNKYATIQNTDNDILLEQLERLMKDEKIYQDATLSLSQISSLLNSNSTKVSNIINHFYKMSFPDFINHYRIEQAKLDLISRENDHLTILAIAENAGFRSKDSFYRAFKKQCGVTPTQYLKLRPSMN